MAPTGGARTRRLAATAVLSAVALLAPVVPAQAGPDPLATVGTREARSEVSLRSARQFALHQLARTDRALKAGRFPTVAPGRRWHTSGTDGWLAGFYPGRLWMAYEASGRRAWARRATTRESPLAVRADDTSTHDLGFLLQTSFGRAVTLTGDERAAAVTVRAARSLATRWVPEVGAIRSWNGPAGQVTVIVDTLVNLELMFSAARLAGRPDWRDLAVRHAVTTAAQHVRPDGSTTHVVRFAEGSGDVVWKGTVQGLADDSTWARGQSWAVYGFTAAYRESGDARLLDAARRTADFATAHLPRDGVPFWDYDAPAAGDRTRDTTAAAALASGLLELARVDPDPSRRATYAAEGLHTLRTLAGPRYLARGSGSRAVLLHGRHDAAVPRLRRDLRGPLLPRGAAARTAAAVDAPRPRRSPPDRRGRPRTRRPRPRPAGQSRLGALAQRVPPRRALPGRDVLGRPDLVTRPRRGEQRSHRRLRDL